MKKLLVILTIVLIAATSCSSTRGGCPSHNKTYFYHTRP